MTLIVIDQILKHKKRTKTQKTKKYYKKYKSAVCKWKQELILMHRKIFGNCVNAIYS